MKKVTLIIVILNSFCLSSQSKTVNVSVDERMELITTVQYLSGYFLLTQADINYTDDIDVYFKDYKNHKAVTLLKDIQNKFFNFDKVPMVMYHYSFPDFKLIHEFTPKELAQINYEANKDKLETFFIALKDFYNSSKFSQFYKSHEQLYNQLIGSVQGKIENHDIIKIMEEHYGVEQQSYNIILTPLLHDGGFATRTYTNKKANLFAIIGPSQNSIETPYFDPDKLLQNYVIHEFSHSFTNPLIDEFYDELEKDSCLLDPIKEAMKKQAYSKWKSCLYEHLVRANEVMLTEQILGSEIANELYKDNYENRSFIYLKGLIPLLKKYKSSRTVYKNLKSIMPEVVNYFHAETKKCNK